MSNLDRLDADLRPLPIVFGCEGLSLSLDEAKFFAKTNPFGLILFARNCEHNDQVRRLINEFRQAVNRVDAPILIDQEGGRVSRLKAPGWPQFPPARLFGSIYENDPETAAAALYAYGRLVAFDLRRMGVTINCAPCVDLFIEGASNAIGNRAFSRKPLITAALARTLAETFLANGIMPVIKHVPGHGRLNVDPHHVSPVIQASLKELEHDDFVPFEMLNDLPAAMNSHAIFTALDPDAPASLSQKINRTLLRESMGFEGVLFSDDIVMKALYGSPSERAKNVLAAGADIALHCNGKLEEMQEIAAALIPIGDDSWTRWQAAKRMVKMPETPYNPQKDSERLDVLLGGSAFQAKSVG